MRRSLAWALGLTLAAAHASAQVEREMGAMPCNGGPASEAVVEPYQIAVSPMGQLCIADQGPLQARRVQAGIVRLLAQLQSLPRGIACDGDGRAYVTTYQDRSLWAIEPAGVVRLLPKGGATRPWGLALGGGFLWFTDQESDGLWRMPVPCLTACTPELMIPASAGLRDPQGVVFKAGKGVYVSDTTGATVRLLSFDGVLTKIAGTGERGFSGDGGPATAAMLNFPSAIAVAADGSLYIADSVNHRVRRVSPSGIITTVMGREWFNPPTNPYPAPGQDPLTWPLSQPQGVAVDDGLGRVYVGDMGLWAIYSMPHAAQSAATATVTRIAATATPFHTPTRLATATAVRTCNIPCL